MSLQIKGISIPALLIKIDKNIPFEDNIKELEEKLSSTFFKGSFAVVDYEDSDLTQEQIQQIEDILKKYNSKILGYKSNENNKDKKEDKLPQIHEKKALKIINKTLRSGQRIEYNGDVLIIGDVNPDAYVIASGNIIVMGSLRGVAHAGANGDETATIIALKLIPQQIRIANYYTRSPDNIEPPQSPEKAYIDNGQIYIEELR